MRIETGRFEGIAEEQRFCPFCSNNVESEFHVIMKCGMYVDIRNDIFAKASEVDTLFNSKNDIDKFVFIFSNEKLIRTIAKSCYLVLNRRRGLLYNNV